MAIGSGIYREKYKDYSIDVNVKNFCSFLAKKYVGFWQSYLEGRVPLF